MCRVGQPSKHRKVLKVFGTRQKATAAPRMGAWKAPAKVQFEWAAKGPIRHFTLAVEITKSFFSL